ncbi:MAG TPA: cation transporter [Atribacteraceae bacterium]|nr:cation transporter [Atribacteraceae bacterium]
MDLSGTYFVSQRILLYIFFLNIAVALIKITYGFLIGSASITADGFHSLTDGAANVLALVGLSVAHKQAGRPRTSLWT